MSDALSQFLNKNSDRAAKWMRIIDKMLDDGESYAYAEDTLVGIKQNIEENERVTDAQIQAVENIRDKPSLGYQPRTYYGRNRRRY